MKRTFIKPYPQEVENDIKSHAEEHANTISHGLGFLLFLVISPFFIYLSTLRGNSLSITGVSIFCISILLLYFASTSYHLAKKEVLRHRFRIMDHVCIYILIAGSYTPFMLIYFNDNMGWIMLLVVWSMALAGSIFKIFYTRKFKLGSTLIYIGMGWAAIFIINPMIDRLPTIALYFILAGGVSYTLGSVFYLWDKLYHNHFIWHLFVIGGTFLHLIAVFYCL